MCDFPSCVAKRTLPPYDSLPTHHHPNCPAFGPSHRRAYESQLFFPIRLESSNNRSLKVEQQCTNTVCGVWRRSFLTLLHSDILWDGTKETKGAVWDSTLSHQQPKQRRQTVFESIFWFLPVVSFDCVWKNTFHRSLPSFLWNSLFCREQKSTLFVVKRKSKKQIIHPYSININQGETVHRLWASHKYTFFFCTYI